MKLSLVFQNLIMLPKYLLIKVSYVCSVSFILRYYLNAFKLQVHWYSLAFPLLFRIFLLFLIIHLSMNLSHLANIWIFPTFFLSYFNHFFLLLARMTTYLFQYFYQLLCDSMLVITSFSCHENGLKHHYIIRQIKQKILNASLWNIHMSIYI